MFETGSVGLAKIQLFFFFFFFFTPKTLLLIRKGLDGVYQLEKVVI